MSLGDESKPHEIRDDPSGESEKDALKPRTSEEIEPVKGGSPDASEKDTGDIERKADVALHTLDAGNDADDPYKTTFDKEGNPIINSGHDVARHLMSDRDDGDPALTLRGFILGSSLAVLANMLSALFSAKPTYVGFGTLFEMLILLVFGNMWAKFFPKPSWVEGRPSLKWLETPLRIFNPGPFGLKEHYIALTMADMGSLTGWATDTLSVSKLFFNIGIKPATAVLGIFSISVMGIGLVGFLSPMIVAPSEIVYWSGIPSLVTIQSLHWDTKGNQRRLKIFGWAMAASFCWEIIPAWMMPWLNGISLPCLASMHAPHHIRQTISKIFGGAAPNQGLGFFAISLDTQYVSFGQFAGYPLKWQIQYFTGSILGAFILLGLYYSNAWNAKSFPFMSPTLFRADGTVYDQMQVFDSGYRVNETAFEEYGPPHMAVSEIFSFFTTALGLGALVTHVIIFLGKEVIQDFRAFHRGTLDDRHWQAIRKNYKPVPEWFYYLVSAISLVAAFTVIYIADTTLPWWGLVIALMFGTFMTPVSLSIYGRYGSAVPTMMASKTIAGAIRPGRPLANLWFCQYSHQVVEVTGIVAANLKAGQFLKLPPRVNVFAQLWGTLLGAYLSWWMMSIVIRQEHDILLDPVGNNQWYGGYYQDLNAQAVEWSLAYKVFSAHGGLRYEWIPLGFLIGAVVPCVHWVAKRYIKAIREAGQNIATPIFCYFLANLGGGINSNFLSCMVLALFSQVWLRVKRPRLFAELNYIVAAAVDGGVSIMIFLLTFAVMGAAGKYTAFPYWFGNPAPPDAPDHCLLPRA